MIFHHEEKFKNYRDTYPEFYYHSYSYSFVDAFLEIEYFFEIPNLASFYPKLRLRKDYITTPYQKEYLEEFIFHIGLLELISYIKCTCSPKIIVSCGYLDEAQISFFKKLYYKGLGEFLYRNGISIQEDEFFEIEWRGLQRRLPKVSYPFKGNLICVGGGKDSCVSLEILKREEDNSCFILNPKRPSLACAMLAGYDDRRIIKMERVIDPRLLELNQEGFLNGHTPLSSLLAFLSYFVAYLSGKRNVILSNEASANQATVLGSDINHQYSKSYEFEVDFSQYMKKTFSLDISYFSLLRGLSEYNIARLFSHYRIYHSVFRSCNLGSKEMEWNWCCHCSKCLFIYIILSPFTTREERIRIFGEDLFERRDLRFTFEEILGYCDTKPFDCVGTFEEARYAISQVIRRGKESSYLLQYYLEHYPLYDEGEDILRYQDENQLNEYFDNLVKEELARYVS